MAKKGTREKNLIVRSQFVAVVEQVLVNGTSHWPMDDALGLGVVPQQVALVVEQFALSPACF
jgi:hypothetical protein